MFYRLLMVTSLEEAFILVSSKFKIPTLNYQQKLAIEKIVLNKKDVFANLPTGFANLLFIKHFHLCLITPPTSGVNVNWKGRTSRERPDQRDDFESVISRNPAAFCQQKMVFPMHPNLCG